MLTKNGNVLLGKIDPTSSASWIDTLGNNIASNNGISPSTIMVGNSKPYIVVGTGNTQPSIEDVNLESIINNITHINSAVSTSVDMDSDFMFCVQSLFKNETENDITIKEVGIMYFWNSYGGHYLLLSRDVLQTPIIIKPNKTYAFSVVV